MRIILHSDINNCYASIESIAHPEYKNMPIVVGGDPLSRHGIILAKNELAKKCGIKTGEALWQAQRKCPSLKILTPNYPLYNKYCSQVRSLYLGYTDLAEPFGPDEAWLDVTASTRLFGGGEKIANEIRERVRKEIGLTVSIGVSYNKVFAKFGSDYKKPDAVTVITPENYRDIVWNAPVSDLLYVGRSTAGKLRSGGIYTIGDIGRSTLLHMSNALGKWGEVLYIYANGLDNTPVMNIEWKEEIKSIGNSTTPPRDILNEQDAKIVLYALSESVSRRMRANGFLCSGVQLHLRDTSLCCRERREKLPYPACTADEICESGMRLLKSCRIYETPLRSIGIRAIDLIKDDGIRQYSFFSENARILKREAIEITAEKIREKYGEKSICRAIVMCDRTLFAPVGTPEPPAAFRMH